MKMKKVTYLILVGLFCLLAPSARADISVVNTDFFHKITLDNISINLLDWDKSIKQWVVDWHPLADDVFELGLYPSNSLPTFSLASPEAWLYSLDQNTWQKIGLSSIKANKIFLKKDPDQITIVPVDLKINIDSEYISINEYLEYDLPANLKLISKVYQLDSQKSDFVAKFHYDSASDWHKQIFQYDIFLGTWTKLDGYNDVEDKFIKKTFSQITGPIYLAIFEEEKARDGVASFYDQSRYRSFAYKNGLYTASRHYPKGTKLKITRLLSGKSIIVTVNDYGPESRTGRLVDLDKEAFKKIASLGAGLIYVKVEEL